MSSSEDAGVSADSGISIQDADDPRLINPELWALVRDDTRDPFAERRPENVECLEAGYQVELLAGETVFSVDTESCNFITISQPLLRGLNPDDQVQGRLWHFDLVSETPTSAYAAFSIGATIVWEEMIPIPSPSGLVLPTWTANASYPRDTPIFFHLNNHGQNSWSLIDLVVETP